MTANELNKIACDIQLTRELFYVCLIAVIITLLVVVTIWYRTKKEATRIMEYSVNVNAVIDDTIPALLESITAETFNDYLMIHAEYVGLEYINSETETKIMKDVGALVSRRISPASLTKLSLYYNLQYISEIISDKIYLLTTSYVVNKNTEKENKNELKK